MTQLEGETKIELLCFLVAAQLFSRIRCGEWMSIEHMFECAQLWLRSNQIQCTWIEQVALVEVSEEMAREALYVCPFNDDGDGISKVFCLRTVWRLDYTQPFVRTLHAMCASCLAGKAWRVTPANDDVVSHK